MYALIAILISSLAATSSLGSNMNQKGRFVSYRLGTTTFEGYVTGNGKKGSVLVVPNWLGISNEAIEKSDQIASLGYTVFTADIYGKDIRPKNSDEAKEVTSKFYKDRDLLRERVLGAFNELKKISSTKTKNFAAIGYCFGGTTVLELARTGTELNGVVTFHGGLDSPRPQDGKNIKAKILVLHGADDPFVTPENLTSFENEMRNHNIDWQLVKYGGAVHSFTDKSAGTDNSRGAAYNQRADERSWQAMQIFLNSVFIKQ